MFGLLPPNCAGDVDFKDIKTCNFGGMVANTNTQILVQGPLLNLKCIKCKLTLHNKWAETKNGCPLDLWENPTISPINPAGIFGGQEDLTRIGPFNWIWMMFGVTHLVTTWDNPHSWIMPPIESPIQVYPILYLGYQITYQFVLQRHPPQKKGVPI